MMPSKMMLAGLLATALPVMAATVQADDNIDKDVIVTPYNTVNSSVTLMTDEMIEPAAGPVDPKAVPQERPQMRDDVRYDDTNYKG